MAKQLKSFITSFKGVILMMIIMIITITIHKTNATDYNKIPLDTRIPNTLGVNTHFVGSQLVPLPREMEMIEKGGFKFIRDDITWSNTEIIKGVYNFSQYDQFIKEQIESKRIRAILIFDYGNPLYDNGLPPYTDEGRLAFANFAISCMKRYQGLGILWEMWNEPNSDTYWTPKANPYQYYLLAKKVYELKMEIVPNEILIGPAATQMGLDFIETIFKYGALKFFDAITVHPYRENIPETVISDYVKLHELIKKYNIYNREIPMFSGEWGYSLLSPNVTDFNMQGKILQRMFFTNLANNIKLSIWYDWKDDCSDKSNLECWFGTVESEYHPNPQLPFIPKSPYLAMTVLSKILNGFEFKKSIFPQNPHFLYHYHNNQLNQHVLVGWTLNQHESIVKIPNQSNQCFKILDWNGNLLNDRLCTTTSGILSIPLQNQTPNFFIPI